MIDRSPLTRTTARVALGLLLSVGVLASACKKDEEPPPMPVPAEEASAEPVVELTLQPEEDASVEEVDAGKKGTGKAAPNLKKCCSALKQNAAGAPEQMKAAMLAAAGVCDAAVASGATSGSALSGIRAALGGAGLPAACY